MTDQHDMFSEASILHQVEAQVDMPIVREAREPAETWLPHEVHCVPFKTMPAADKVAWAELAKNEEVPAVTCSFKNTVPGMPDSCAKPGGMCSIASSSSKLKNTGVGAAALCPGRLVNAAVFTSIAKAVLGCTRAPLLMPEVLVSGQGDEGVSKEDAAGSRFDYVLIDPDNSTNHCAVEVQSVYMSGVSQHRLFEGLIESAGTSVPTNVRRRPDYRSSAKRLAAQLITKSKPLSVASGGREKTVVVVDDWFRHNFGKVVQVPARQGETQASVLPDAQTLAECQIVFAVVSLKPGSLELVEMLYCTIGDAARAINPPDIVSMNSYQNRIDARLKVGAKHNIDARDKRGSVYPL